METVKGIINHPLSKALACGIIGLLLIMRYSPQGIIPEKIIKQ